MSGYVMGVADPDRFNALVPVPTPKLMNALRGRTPRLTVFVLPAGATPRSMYIVAKLAALIVTVSLPGPPRNEIDEPPTVPEMVAVLGPGPKLIMTLPPTRVAPPTPPLLDR